MLAPSPGSCSTAWRLSTNASVARGGGARRLCLWCAFPWCRACARFPRLVTEISAGRRHARSSDRTRRRADETLESPAECGLRLVAEAESQLAERGIVLLQPRDRGVHSPAGDVMHGRLADEFREACGKCRTRYGNLLREGGNRPGSRRVSMNQRDGPPDLRIPQRP